jgi:site-specific DNA recombinase
VIAIYCRVSTDEQAQKGYSINGQIEDCKKFIGTNEFLEYIDDGYTGEILNRPALLKLQDDIENGIITKVVCYDPDRLSRKLFVQLVIKEQFKKNGVSVEFVHGNYSDDEEGEMQFQIKGAISEYDKAKIKRNTMAGRHRKAKNGEVVKNNGLYGYDYDKKKNTYVINENEAKFIRMIFDYYTNPNSPFKGINGIANHLTEIGAPTKKGAKTWHRQVVRQMLMNEAYTGVYYQNRYDTVGHYVKKQSGEKVEYKIRPKEEWLVTNIPAIISKEQFEYAQRLLDQGRRRYANHGKHNYLLSGLVRCGRCGATMTGRRTLSHGKDYFIYECRKNYAGAKTKGCGKQMSENKLNTFVWDTVIDLLANPEKIKDFSGKEETSYIKDELEHLEKEIEKTKKGRKRLFRLISLGEDDEDDEFDLKEVKEEIRDLQLKEKDLQSKYNQLKEEVQPKKDERSETAFDTAMDLYVMNREKEFTLEEKKNLLNTIVKEIILVDSDTVTIQLF